jgi:hypothetical protein
MHPRLDISAFGGSTFIIVRTSPGMPRDPKVLAYFCATGRGWQSMINEALRKAVGL